MIDFHENLFDHEICVVAFASDSQQVFEFGDTLHDCGVPHVLLRDSHTWWYQHGVAGIGDRKATVDYIRRLCDRYYVKTIGVSSGAYGALLYGQFARVHEVIAISPVTGKQADDFDPQWRHYIEAPPDYIDPSPIDDLRQFFRDGPVPRVVAFVTDGIEAERVIDHQMAARIGIKDIRWVRGYQHSTLARGMRDRGMLRNLIVEKEP